MLYVHLLIVVFVPSGLGWYIPGLSRPPTQTPPPSTERSSFSMASSFDPFFNCIKYHNTRSQLSSAWFISSAELNSAPQGRAVPCGVVPCRAVRYCAVLCSAVCFLYLLFRTCQVSFEVSYQVPVLLLQAHRSAVRCRAVLCGAVPCCVLCCTYSFVHVRYHLKYRTRYL